MKLTVGEYAILISIIIGFFFTIRRNTNRFLKILPYFLLISFVVEVYGYSIHTRRQTAILYNFFTAFEFLFYIWLISYMVKSVKASRILKIISIVYFGIALINILFIQGITNFHSITYAIGCVVLIACCLYYIIELFQTKESVNIARQPAFWICSGLLFFYACSFPIYGLGKFMMSFPNVIIHNIYEIIITMNVLLYLMFTIAYLCRIKIRKSSPSLS